MENAELIEVILLSCILLYCIFLWWIRSGWKKCVVKSESYTFGSHGAEAGVAYSGLTKISVVIAMRNESVTIGRLLDSLVRQSYPLKLVEFIFVDDHSDDDTAGVVRNFFSAYPTINFKVLHSEQQGKKATLAKGIESAWHELIITTDADCVLPADHLRYIVSSFEKLHFFLLAGPVKLTGPTAFLTELQKLEMAGLTAISGGALTKGRPMLCNGANLAFRRSSWLQLMKGSYHQAASGDDTDLLQRFYEAFPEKVYYAASPSVLVETPAAASWSDFLEQRRRWSSKIVSSMSGFTIFIALIAWLVHALLAFSLIGIFSGHFSAWFLLALLLKAFSEAMVIDPVLKLYGEAKADKQILMYQPFYWFYILIAGPTGLLFSYRWKGRRTR